MGTPSPTARSRLAIGPADPPTNLINFFDYSPGVRRETRDTNATRGAYEKDGNRKVTTKVRVLPRITTVPTANELHALLEYGHWGTPTGTTTKTYPLSNTPLEWYHFFAPANGNLWFLSNVCVDAMTISATSGEALRVELQCVGKSYSTTHDPFGALAVDQAYRPFTLAQLVATYGGQSKQCREFSYRISHGIDRERYLNSLNITDLVPLRREIALSIDIPSGDNADFWDDGENGIAVAATFTNVDGDAFTLTFPDWRPDPVSPEHPNDAEGFLRLEGELYRGAAQATPTVLTLTT